MSYPAEVLRDTAFWMVWFGQDLAKPEAPDRIHSHAIGRDGTPRWAPEFTKWLTRDEIDRPKADDSRERTDRAMRKLRKSAIRAYEVLFRMLVEGESTSEVTRWLNKRAVRNGISLPPGRDYHYNEHDTMAIVISGIEYLKSVW